VLLCVVFGFLFAICADEKFVSFYVRFCFLLLLQWRRRGRLPQAALLPALPCRGSAGQECRLLASTAVCFVKNSLKKSENAISSVIFPDFF
jgi:hypothetical protein